ncbi:MAG: hypothetical protein IJF67_12875 [Clostridia bacterium]|nr:hypothetical protein [Clostridia bacterium]
MKKQFTIVLAMLMLANLAACGGDAPAADTTAADTTADTTAAPEVLTDGLPEVDMNGFVFSVYNNSKEKMTWTNTTLDVAELTGDVLDDAIFNRNRYVEERFNCIIEVTSEGDQIGTNEISAEVMAGDSNFDIWMPRDYNVVPSIPYLRSLNDLPYVDLDAEWWFPTASELFKFNGEQYGATGYFSLSEISRAGGIAFNEDLYNSFGLDKTLYDHVREGTWTLETFHNVAKLAVSDLNGDGQMDDNDRWGFTGNWKEMYVRFINGSGVSLIEKNGDAYPEFTLPTNELAIDKMLYIFNLFNGTEAYRNPYTSSLSDMYKDLEAKIENNTALFALGHPNHMGGKYRTAVMNVGFLPSPKYDEKQDRYYCPTWAGEVLAILKTLPDDRIENVSIILEALSFDSAKEGGVMDIYKEVMMKGKYAIHEDCMEMFDIVLDSLYFDYGVVAWEEKVVYPIVLGIYASGTGNVASTLAENEPVFKNLIDTLIKNIEENKE